MLEKLKTKRQYRFKSFFQLDEKDCGPTCLKMILNYYGKIVDINFLREKSYISKSGVNLLGISQAAEYFNLETLSVKLDISYLYNERKRMPCILHWNQNHFVVLLKIKNLTYTVVDPAYGIIKLTSEEFKKNWLFDKQSGIALFLKPTSSFNKESVKNYSNKKYIIKLFYFLKPFKKKIFFMFLIIISGGLLTLILPFLTQYLVDKGVVAKNLNIIKLLLLAQLAIYVGSITLEIVRNWLVLHIGTKLGINVISDFLIKTLKLPISFFESKMIGDFQQRVHDNDRIEQFLTSDSLLTLFSIITFFVFFGVLWYYDYRILLTYFSITIASITWSMFWFKKRKFLDYFKFQQKSESQDKIYHIINGVQEIKLNQLEDEMRTGWEKIQYKLFKTNTRILKLDQLQLSGFQFLNQIKNIIVTFLASTYVVQGSLTLGMLLSISYIIGQMNSPVNQIISFCRSLQDAKLSFERLFEVQNYSEEEYQGLKKLTLPETKLNFNEVNKIGMYIKNLYFQYEGPKSPFVLKNINLYVPEGKVTAIVGASGSGKTTLMKLLLRFYDPIKGDIFFNDDNILTLSPKSIRENIGVVMQDGYIFPDTIEKNIAPKGKETNKKRLKKAVQIANIDEFIESLPLKYNTKIGVAGNGLSGGQKQRILIARAAYKNPHYIFLDEATSSLDAENEKTIYDNLQKFFRGKTVIIIAHRLSTVKNADNIVVLKKGRIIEQGTHQQLVNKKAEYFNLVKNQLELGN